MKNRGMVRRPLALTAATTIALGGLFFATPAYAESAPADEPTQAGAAEGSTSAEDAPSAETIKTADDAGVVAWGTNANGAPVVVVVDEGDAADTAEIDAFAAEAFEADAAEPVIVEIASAPKSYAEGDVVGGQGYLVGGACSFGFAAWSPSGAPAMLSAGHCALGETESNLSIPSQEPAVGGPGFVAEDPIVNFGSFGFSQFGGPGNSEGYDNTIPLPDQDFTDISVIDVNTANGYNPLPEVTDWSTATDSVYSLADSTIAITSVGDPVLGSVSKSGRTTGYTTGEIVETNDPDTTHILDGWSNIDGHIVRGFSSNVLAGPGDSGGAVFQGNTAVGLISGGTEADADNPQWTWSTLLTDALPYTDGYTVALHLDAPVVTAPASGSTVEVGATVTGTAPGAESVEVTVGGETSTVAVADGAFSFTAPGELGEHAYTLTSVNGFNTSESTAYSLTVEAAPTPAPAITSPADGSAVVDAVTSVSGTGVPGAAVVVTIAGTDHETTVDGSGNWVVDGLDLTYGSHTISVVQTANDNTSDAATSAFDIVMAAPVVTSITNGTVFPHNEGPATLEGTGVEGATVTVELTGTEPAAFADSGEFTATVVDGAWTVDFGAALTPGTYTVAATQSLNDVLSAPASLAFEVVAAPAPGGDGGNAGGGGDGELAVTGGDMIVPLSASAGALVLLAGGITLMTLRRRKLMQS